LARLRSCVFRFARENRGVVTVEWVAIAAAVVVGAITIAWLVFTQVQTQSNSVGTPINDVSNTPVSQPPP
jgi:Flp pilus assembly pilin Flp